MGELRTWIFNQEAIRRALFDNASSNDTVMGFFKSKLVSWGSTFVRSKYMHMRCIAHILNLVVQDGLKFADSSVKSVRDAVRWYQTVFEAYEENDSSFSVDLSESVSTFLDWFDVKSLTLLKSFYDMTMRISGYLYVISSTIFNEISYLSCMLDDMIGADSGSEIAMGSQMKIKFEKYWGDPEKMNCLIFFVIVLDPRDKAEYMPHQFTQLYGEVKGKECFAKVQSAMAELFNDYAATYSVSMVEVPLSTVASEYAFSTSGRVLDPFRSSLTPKIVKALICTQDWLRLPNQSIQIEENIDDCERLEKELPSGVRSAGPAETSSSLSTIAAMIMLSPGLNQILGWYVA
ncbi:zinc finger BED domain-containing protein RICESLEEPER 1-like [Ipomoea triloba]|uniref:zinc finger BED domain-containing protein RICESLEEPER 1-like n=1 Tax=Ipomoea triloba TaxID=35885 RepID=UPI00125E0C09|nr:zinc finger BED domain-containing protein RICESLEEPER 1-like [Ipomoea triloba]